MRGRVVSETWPPSGSLTPPSCEVAVRPGPPRTFDLVRFHDVSGVSGEGIVAQGVQFADGQVALQWPKPGRSVAVWDSVDALLRIHGHNGLTVVRFHDGED